MNRRSLLLASLALAGSAQAAIKPDTRVTLLAGDMIGGEWRAGLEIDIGPEWKTYWRMPGDAGIPPDFDWSGSTNLKSVEVIWPAPARFHDLAGETIGYKTRVLFPLRITPQDAAKPPALLLKLFFAVCKDICIPANAESAVMFDRLDPVDAGKILVAEALAPARGQFISSVRLSELDGKPALQIALAQAGHDGLDIFVEGTEPAYVRAPVWTGGGCRLPVSGLKDGSALRGKTLCFTMVGANIRLEQDAIVE